MITHNGKQVTLAMRNRKAINLIARNGKAMFGEFIDWQNAGIDAAAKAVILAEYGSVVWSDVRDYAKAHPAIVPFINQDPHLAASISPNSNKERWLYADNQSYINTGIMQVQDCDVEFRFITTTYTTNSDCQIFLTARNAWAYDIYGLFARKGAKKISFHGSEQVFMDFKEYNTYIFSTDHVASTGTVTNITDGESKTLSLDLNPASQTGLQILGLSDKSRCSNVGCSYLKVSGATDAWFIPHLTADGQCGMLDLVTLTFHPNANTSGQFTIAITDKE